ncbi:MAG: extracellular solute-binding protein [Lachnospiraceae bacterium]|nr:extracellular solute-binding protein [Lachnospiraceae bacterium]
MRKKSMWGKALALALSAVLGLSLMACGGDKDTANENKEGKNGANTGVQSSEFVYVPEFTDISSNDSEESNSWRGQVMLQGDKLYYSMTTYNEETGESTSQVCTRDITDLTKENVMDIPALELEGYTSSVSEFFYDSEGNLLVFYYVSPPYIEGEEYDYNDNTTYLAKYDSSMKQIFAQDMKDMFQDEMNSYIQNIAVGKSGNIYASSNDLIYVICADGVYQTAIPTQSDWINDMFATEDGRVFFTRYSMTGNGMEMVEINTETNAMGETFKNLPDMNSKVKGGSEGKVLVKGTSNLYEYDLATQEATPILNWIDCYLTGDYVQDFAVMEDGNVLVYYDDYEGQEELVKLVKTEGSKVAQKEIITFATLYDGNQSLEQAVVKFNKNSDKYKITFKTYIDNNAEWTETTYTDAIALMNADLTGNNAPDLIDLSSVDLNNLSSKGVLEDLAPYLESSTVLKKSDFVESVLNAYTIGGKLVTIPRMFQMSTLMGKTSVVGEKQGWTIDDVIALADAHPDAKLLQYVTKESALQICLQYSSNSFIDYETGACSFNSPEFIKVLEFANRFDAEYNYNSDESFPDMIQSGKILLSDAYVSDVQEFQMYNLMFEEEVTCIGYPTVDGSVGVFLTGTDMYGMTAKSAHKEGAWQFLESLLAYREDDRYAWGIPTRVDEMDAMFEEDMTPEYQYDENGEIMYDENGVALQYPKTTWGYDDWEAEIYAATQEEVDAIKAMIDIAKPAGMNDQTIFQMITEDAKAYFEGQKSAKEVADVIQSRVEIYVSENS